MRLIECKLGAAEPIVGSTPYRFERDRFGRFVARVFNPEHADVLLAVEHYREVPEEPAPAADEPKTSRGKKKAAEVSEEPAPAADEHAEAATE